MGTYKSRYTGSVVDATISKARHLSYIDANDKGKALIIDEDGIAVASKITRLNIDSEIARNGQVLTADGLGGTAWSGLPQFKPQFLGYARSAENKFSFSNIDEGYHGVMLFTYGNTMTLLPAYGLQVDTTYSTSAAIVNQYNRIVNVVLNYRRTSENVFEVWTDNDNYHIIDDYIGYLYLLPLD